MIKKSLLFVAFCHKWLQQHEATTYAFLSQILQSKIHKIPIKNGNDWLYA